MLFMDDRKRNCYIEENDRYTENSADAVLNVFSNNSTPLPLIFKEIYGDRRLIFYTTEYLSRKYICLINCVLFYYGEDVVFCSDNAFGLSGGKYEWYKKFIPINEVNFKEGDFFFGFDFECSGTIIDKVKSAKLKTIDCEVFRKAYIGALEHYIFKIRPAINFVAKQKNIQLVLVDNFAPDFNHLTKWEKYLYDNNLVREKMVEKLRGGQNPYPNGFYDEQYSIEDLLSFHIVPNRIVDKRGVIKLCDYTSKYVNVVNGVRVTWGQPKVFKRTIHIYGGCGFYGIGMPDKSTFASRLQLLFNKYATDEMVRVVNHGNFIWGKQDAMWYIVNSIAYNEGDIIILPYNQRWFQFFYKKIPNIIYADITQRHGGEIFNDVWHPSENGIYLYARNLFEFLKEHGYFKDIKTTLEENIHLYSAKQYGIPAFADAVHSNELNKIKGLDRKNKELLINYIQKISNYKPLIGSIVMNCNPFTLGHRYLIEYAASRVEHLFIFAVEEDKSFFPFKDRIELIRKGTADLSNVTVIPSGQFIISAITFTDYFGKSELQDKTIDASMDLEIFGMYIAPALNINIRFAGEEPIDKVTKQYNEQMKKILPTYGIKFEEVPRKEAGGNVISASRVRQLLKLKDFKEIKKLVPRSTFEYLKKNFS